VGVKLYRTIQDLRDEAARLQECADQATAAGDVHKAASYQGRADKFTRRANQSETTTRESEDR
jgi:hypothetical protein